MRSPAAVPVRVAAHNDMNRCERFSPRFSRTSRSTRARRRAAAREPQLRKRFYEHAHTGDKAGEGFPLLLDGKQVKTPARRPLAAPSQALAEKLADEWNAQAEVIDPGRMPLTRLANAVIDAVADAPQPVADEVAKYLGSDLLCYRAEAPAGLVELQNAALGSGAGLGARCIRRSFHAGARRRARVAAA